MDSNVLVPPFGHLISWAETRPDNCSRHSSMVFLQFRPLPLNKEFPCTISGAGIASTKMRQQNASTKYVSKMCAHR